MADAQARQAMQQQLAYEQLGMQAAGQQMSYDQHLRQQALLGKNARFNRGLQMYDRGTNLAGSLMGALGGAPGGVLG
jgi:hypothetical protein